MANVLHSSLTGSDLHECKGAASAASGQVPVATGSGSAPFSVLSYTQLGNTPLPKLQLNGTASTGQAIMKVYTTTSAVTTGAFTVAISGFTAIWGVFPNTVANNGGSELGALVAIKTVSTSSITGNVYSYTNTTNAALGGAPVQLLVIGV